MLELRLEEFLEVVLQLEEPWYVSNTDATPERVDIILSTRAKALVKCPVCGDLHKVHDKIERTWKHTDVCDAECYITAKIPRCNCPKCGIKQINIPWARGNVSYTKSFEDKAIRLMK